MAASPDNPSTHGERDGFPSLDRSGSFGTTQWTKDVEAARGSSPDARRALERLCRTYWYPLYCFVRRSGYSTEEAEDLTQGFFAHLLEENLLAKVSREKGRFRSFLLACLKNYLSVERLEDSGTIVVMLANRGGMHSELSPNPEIHFFREVLLPRMVEFVNSDCLL